jgi:hypothetical protein
MTDSGIAKAIVIGSIVVGASIVLGCFIMSRAPRFEKTATLELIDVRSGAIYTRTGSMGEGQPKYIHVPGPRSRGAHVDTQ